MFSYNKDNTIQDRILMIVFSFTMIIFFLLLLPNSKIPIINKWGKNSLYIFLFHRIITIITQKEFFNEKKHSNYI